MKKFLVITTINQPTKAIFKFVDILSDEWKIIIVWDRKWPEWYLDNDKIIFLDIETQYKLYPELSKSIPERHYARKNIWYYHAIKLWADYIAETDDDNIPYDFYPQFIDEKTFTCDLVNIEWSVNIYKYFTDKNIWPRWLDLQAIKQSPLNISQRTVKPYIQHSLEDKDPDVDAIYRLVIWEDVYFNKNKHIALWDNTRCPFNTQNTYRHKEAFPFIYIPHSVIWRASDIWKSYIAQKCVKNIWWTVIYSSPTVYQERNNHNLQVDFNEEIVCYKNANALINDLEDIKFLDTKDSKSLIIHVYEELIKKWYFDNSEMETLKIFLKFWN